MEQHLPIVAKKIWNLVRVALFMLKKGISKSKLLADLNMMLKRGKLAGKAIQNLMFHQSHLWAAAAASSSATTTGIQRTPDRQLPFSPKPDEYEFSCSPSPDHKGVSFHLPFHLSKRKNARKREPQHEEGQLEAANVVMRAIEMLKSETVSASPVNFPGFGKSPIVRQLRVTDSPFPINYCGNDDDKHVDEAADQFIKRFYKDLRRQNRIAWGTPGR